MTTCRSIVALILMTVGPPLQAQVRVEGYGISLNPPREWAQIPDSVVAGVEAFAAQSFGVEIDYVAGFQPEPGGTWLELPYVLVQVFESPPISEAEFLEALESGVLDASVSEIVAQATGTGVLDAASFGQPVWDAESHILWRRFTLISAERGEFEGLTGQILFRHGILFLHYYFELGEPVESVRASAEDVLLATVFDPGSEYSESAAAAARPGSLWSRVLTKGVFGAIAGGLIAGLFALIGGVRRKRKVTSS